MTAALRHRCGAEVSYSDYLAGLCAHCGFLIEEPPPEPPVVWRVFVCSEGCEMHSVRAPQTVIGTRHNSVPNCPGWFTHVL